MPNLVIPAIAFDPDATVYVPSRVLMRCSLCLNSVELTVLHSSDPETGETDDGRPFLLQQLRQLGWTVNEDEEGPWTTCRNHGSLATADHVSAEFDVRAFNMVANVFTVACLACNTEFPAAVQRLPEEVAVIAGAHFNTCQQASFAWSDYRLNLPPRRPGSIAAFEITGTRTAPENG